MLTSFAENLLDSLFFAEIQTLDELDRQAVFPSQAFGVLPDLVSQRFGELGVVEDPDLTVEELLRHRRRITDLGNHAGDHHPVEARQLAADPAGVALCEKLLCHGPVLHPEQDPAPTAILSCAKGFTCLVPARPG